MAEVRIRTHSIKSLDPFCAVQIEASATIPDLNSVIEGLLCNSLDAGATRIDLVVDHSRAACSVEDNGEGIAVINFREGSRLGKSTVSTRTPSSRLHGGRGKFLALLASLCKLSIVSRDTNCHSYGKIVLHDGKTMSRQIQASSLAPLIATRAGTRVEVCNLFAGLPIRRRQRALHRNSDGNNLNSLTSMILALLLSWLRPTVIRLHLQQSGKAFLFGFSPSVPTAVPHRPSRTLEMGASQDILDQFLCRSGRASASWTSISATTASLNMQGIISIGPNSSKNVQFISFGVKPLRPTTDWDEVYVHLNQLFSDSSFGAIETNESDRHSVGPSDERWSSSKKRTTNDCRAHSRWPMFSFNIGPSADADQNYKPVDIPDVGAIDRILAAAVKQWLFDHGFLNRRLVTYLTSTSKSSGHPTAARSTSSHVKNSVGGQETLSVKTGKQQINQQNGKQDLSHISRIRTGYAAAPRRPASSQRPVTTSTSVARQPQLAQTSGERVHLCTKIDSESAVWTDPVTMTVMHINPRTGMPYFQSAGPRDLGMATSHQMATSDFASATAGLLLTRRQPAGASDGKHAQSWLNGVTGNWSKTLFQTSEAQIRSLGERAHERHGECAVNLDAAPLDCPSKRHQLTRASIRKAKVIAQVDKKFILIKAPSSHQGQGSGGEEDGSETDTMVLVDQHAADERCLVESLYTQMCAPRVHHVDNATSTSKVVVKPITVMVTHEEAQLLSTSLARFLEFGIEVEIKAHASKPTGMATIVVRRLPAAVMERCMAEPRLIVDALRREAYAGNRLPTPCPSIEAGKKHEKHEWLRRIGHCPQGIIEMLHSQACRRAIMFNDELDMKACRALVERLTECALPFQCAHGRPSMVPLVELRSVGFEELYAPEVKGVTTALFVDWAGR